MILSEGIFEIGPWYPQGEGPIGMELSVIADQGEGDREAGGTVVGQPQDDPKRPVPMWALLPKSGHGIHKKITFHGPMDKIGRHSWGQDGDQVPVFIPFCDEPEVQVHDVKSVQFPFIEGKILGIPHVETVVLHPGNQIVLFFIELDGKVEQELVTLGFDAGVVFRDIEILHPEYVGTLPPARGSRRKGQENHQPPWSKATSRYFRVSHYSC